MVSWLRLSRREESHKSAEILLLRHQLTVLRRKVEARPKVTWADRALIAALLGIYPEAPAGPVADDRDAGDRVALAPRHRAQALGREIEATTSRTPPTHHRVGALVLRLAGESPSRGTGASTGNSLVWASLSPPRRCGRSRPKLGSPRHHDAPGRLGHSSLRAQAKAILAADFFCVDLNGSTAYVLAVIEHATRRVRVLSVPAHPNNAWVTQQARKLLMDLEDRIDTLEFLIRERDTRFTAPWDAVFTSVGIAVLRSPPQSPRANAIMDCFIGGCRRELLDRR